SCRFPGASNPESYWDLLISGKHSTSKIPLARWDVEQYYAANPAKIGCISTQFGSFLDGSDKFDASFFQVSSREANLLDPQQRLILEVSWEALENSGIAPSTLAGNKVGVFIGQMHHDYERCIDKLNTNELYSVYTNTGNAPSITAGRVA